MDDLLSPFHILALLILALIIFGPRRLPELGGAVGKTIREFQKSMHEAQAQVSDVTHSIVHETTAAPPSGIDKPN